ncbi:MAG: hypothetical protein AAF922_10500 [Pseudomonadota bacterium]
MEAREQMLGDRVLGLARWQNERIHQGRPYDFEMDSDESTPVQ